jgi:hypothetical protein
MAAMSVAVQRPLNRDALAVSAADPEGWRQQLKSSDVAADRGGEVIALVMPRSMRTRLWFLTGFVLDALRRETGRPSRARAAGPLWKAKVAHKKPHDVTSLTVGSRRSSNLRLHPNSRTRRFPLSSRLRRST